MPEAVHEAGGGPGGGADRCPVPRSPPRPSPGGLHYSDEDLCNKYNGAALTESAALQEKPGDATESEVGARPPAAGSGVGGPPVPRGPCAGLNRVSTHTHTGSRQAEPGQRVPLPRRGGSTLLSGARGHLPGQSLVQSGLWVCKPPCCSLRSDRDPIHLKVTGERGGLWTPEG